MGQVKKEEEIIPAGQEDVKALTTANSVVDGGTLVRPKEDTVIVGTKDSLLGDGVEHTVHRVLAEKLIAKGQATAKK
jgi:archaeosine-15-forming tRNA-guanine transglycosylase